MIKVKSGNLNNQINEKEQHLLEKSLEITGIIYRQEKGNKCRNYSQPGGFNQLKGNTEEDDGKWC